MRTKKAIKNIIASLLLQVINVICGFILPRLIIETYGSATNGLIASITQFLAYITLLESGFGPVVKSLLYGPIANKNKIEIENILYATEKFFRNIVKIFLIYLIILTIVFPIIVGNQFDKIYTISLVLILAISTIFEYFFGITYSIYLQAEQKTYVTAYIQTITIIVNTIAVIVLIKVGNNIQVVKIVSTIIFVLKPIIQNEYIKKKYKINLKDANKEYKIKQKWDGLAQHIAAVIHGNTDVAVLTIFSNIKEVSVYSIYLLVINGVKNIVTSFTGGIDASFGDMIAKNEIENLNKKFKIYEYIYHTISTIIFTCTLILIVPFVKVYTNGITDVNYIRTTFAALMVLAELMWAIRLPYSSIVLAAGHFKETQIGAWIEAISNIIISVILVFNFGIIGVAIGTLFAMTIRTLEFIYHSSKYILKRNILKPYFRLIIIAIEIIIVFIISKLINENSMNNYADWSIYALKIFFITTLTTVFINYVTYNKDAKEFHKIIKNILIKKLTIK